MAKEEKIKEQGCACGEECKCKKGKLRKTLFVVFLISIFAVIAFGIGVVIGGYILVDEEKIVVENKEEDNSNTEKKGIEINNETILYSYKEQLSIEKDLSFKSIEDVEAFVDTANYFTDTELRNALLEGGHIVDINHFMFAYMLTALNGGGFYSIDKSYIKEVANSIFDNDLEYLPYSGSLYYSASSINYMCLEKICFVHQVSGGGGGADAYQTKVVETKKDGENTIYVIKEYFSEFENGIYTESDGELLCKHGSCPEDIFETYGDKLNTYEMKFDKNNRYVTSKMVK